MIMDDARRAGPLSLCFRLLVQEGSLWVQNHYEGDEPKEIYFAGYSFD